MSYLPPRNQPTLSVIAVFFTCLDGWIVGNHYGDVIMGAIASQITSLTIVSNKTSKLRVTGLCAGNSPGTGEFSAQMASYAEMFPFDDVIMYMGVEWAGACVG